MASRRVSKSRFTDVRQLLRENVWVYVLIGIILGLLLPALLTRLNVNINDFLLDLVPEAVGIVFTVAIIDTLDRRREDRLIKEQLVRQLHSYYNSFALQAIEELRVLGYLSDGSCREQDLRGSDWREGNLYEADLTGSDLTNAKLHKTDFVGANLTDVKVTDEQLVTTLALWKATMPDGSRYNGRFNLAHDFAVARRKGFNPDDSESMAKYYDVPLESYLEGQRWAREHLDQLRARAGGVAQVAQK
jgi:hypothetical protein